MWYSTPPRHQRPLDLAVLTGPQQQTDRDHRALVVHPHRHRVDVDDWGERVQALVVPVAGGTLTIEELTTFCRARIAGYKTPHSMEIVDGLPISTAGKVLERELRRPYWEGQERAVHCRLGTWRHRTPRCDSA